MTPTEFDEIIALLTKDGYYKAMRKTPLRRISPKRAREVHLYGKGRAIFLASRPYCEIFEPDRCTRKATQIHHVKGTEGNKLLDEAWWLPACFECHRFLHDHPAYARERGFTA